MPSIDNLSLHHLLSFKMYNKHQTLSTCVADIFYDPETFELTVQFVERGTYKYTDVPMKEYVDFSLASSQGKYFNFYIRNQYNFERIS